MNQVGRNTRTWLDIWRLSDQEAALTIEADGSVFVVDFPERWSSPAVKSAQVGDVVGFAMELLGSAYRSFVDHGGSAALLWSLIEDQIGNPTEVVSLLEFLDEHGEAVEADLLRFYHLDLASDLGGPTLPWPRLARLLRHLPPESATWQAVAGPDAVWSTTDHLLALVVDVLQVANWQRAGDKRAKRPEPLPRPGMPGRARRSALSPAQMRRRLHDLARRAARRRQVSSGD